MNNKSIGIIILILILGGFFWWQTQKNPTQNPTSNTTNSQMLAKNSDTEIQSQEVEYFSGTTGFYAEPAEGGTYPGVVMIHEWWGLNQNIKDMALELAKDGYQVLAVDLYSGQVAAGADQARQLVSALDQEQANSNMKAAVAYLKSQGATKVASLGWCFGGGQSLQLALSGQSLDATVIYYGNLVTDRDRLAGIKWPVLGIFGADDTSIPVATVNEFHDILHELNIENSVNIYPGVGHAFANPTGANYAPEETKDAWNRTITFFDQNLK